MSTHCTAKHVERRYRHAPTNAPLLTHAPDAVLDIGIGSESPLSRKGQHRVPGVDAILGIEKPCCYRNPRAAQAVEGVDSNDVGRVLFEERACTFDKHDELLDRGGAPLVDLYAHNLCRGEEASTFESARGQEMHRR